MENPLSFLLWDAWSRFWPHVTLVILTLALHLVASAHAVLHKRDVRAAIGWVAIIWLVPVVGPVLYVWLGINRINRKAKLLRAGQADIARSPSECACSPDDFEHYLAGRGNHLRTLARCIGEVTERPLLHGNRVEPLYNGQEAYPAMLEAIEQAQQTISLATYIFDYDQVGRQFVEALGRAVQRGVEVRVLVDDIGARYHRPSISKPLAQAKVPVARFLKTLVPVYFPYSNLRIHRKILVVDGRLGFTGGMNIRGLAMRDLQFRITGPAVAHLQDVFAEDWEFTTNEVLQGEAWFPELEPDGNVLARGIPDGPDEDFEKLRISLLAALACAETSVTIVTPYFLPDSALVMALGVAAMRGVEVNIILPQQNNLRMVQWASTAGLWEILERGCHVWLSPPPFDHTKLMIVDRTWVLLGSGNWDPRSLRLNFEFNVECYDTALAERLHEQTGATVRNSRQMTLADVEKRPLPLKLRDGVARLFSPYL